MAFTAPIVIVGGWGFLGTTLVLGMGERSGGALREVMRAEARAAVREGIRTPQPLSMGGA